MAEKRIWEIFPEIAEAVRQSHIGVGLYGGHDWGHAFRVGEIARQIYRDEYGGDKDMDHLTGLAGVCHNADRVEQKKMNVGRREVPKKEVVKLIRTWLYHGKYFRPDDEKSFKDTKEVERDIRMIVEAVISHDGKNSQKDSKITICLKDADRVVNLDGDSFIRSAQHYHDFPAVDMVHFLDDPKATYPNPKSVLRDIAYSLDWVDPNSNVCVRTRLGKKLGEKRAHISRMVVDGLREQFSEEGLHPWPFDGISNMPPEKPAA